MTTISIEELKERVKNLENYLSSIGRALKKKGPMVRDSVRVHEQHEQTTKLVREKLESLTTLMSEAADMGDYVDIVFDGPPGPEAGRFVEVEDSTGKSIKFGEWVKRGDGYWVLRVDTPVELEVGQ